MRAPLFALTLLACAPPDDAAQSDDTGTDEPPVDDTTPAAPAETEGTPGCDNLELTECLFPFPSNAFLDTSGDVPRVVMPAEVMPEGGIDEAPFDTSAFAEARGFGIASPILFQLPGAVVPVTPGVFDPAPSLQDDHPTVLIDTATGARIPHWIETDYLATDAEVPVAVVRPAVALPRGTTIVVGVRGLVDEVGDAVPAPAPFAALRDGAPSIWRGLEARRSTFDDVVFPTLADAGVPRDTLQLAWSFTTQSTADATRPMLAVRDAIFDALPEDGPDYTITDVQDCREGGAGCHPDIAVVIDGLAHVPSVMGPPDDLGVRRIRWDGDTAVVEGTEDWPFRLQIPHIAYDGAEPVPVMQYGHGFLGGRGEANNGWIRDAANRLGFAILATDMQGMSGEITPVWLEVLLKDGGRFPTLADLAMQGVANQLVQQRMVKTSLADDDDPAFLRDDDRLAWDPTEVWYYGNSQGGSVGTVVMGTTLDVQRGGLGVPGSGYPFLLHRSTVFSPFAAALRGVYPQPTAIPKFLALLGTGWDAFDPLTFAPHLHGDPLPGTPDHDVLLHVAKEDQQVHNEASFILGRTADAVLMTPSVRPVWGLPTERYPASPGAGVVEVDFSVPDDVDPLDPPGNGVDANDTHGWLRAWPPAQDQLVTFLATGEIVDVCDGEPCAVDGRP